MFKVVFTPSSHDKPALIHSYHRSELEALGAIVEAIPNEWEANDPQEDAEVNVAIVRADGELMVVVVGQAEPDGTDPFYTVAPCR